jgi:hypothetical protein
LSQHAAVALNRALGGDLSDPLTLIAMPALFQAMAVAPYRGVLPAERCVDDCLILTHAYAQLGIAAEVRIAELTVTEPETGNRAVHGSLEPWWEDDMIHGHMVVWLPVQGCLVDPTAEQWEEIADYRQGPVITLSSPTANVGISAANGAPGIIRVAGKRGYLRLVYLLGPHEASAALLDHPHVHGEGDGYARRGVAIASEVLTRLASRRPVRETSAIPYPRMAALAEAVRTMKVQKDDEGYVYFTQNASGRPTLMRLDEIPGIPAPELGRSAK